VKDRLRIACHAATIRLGLKYAFTVGPVLVLINYGDAMWHHDWAAISPFKVALTMSVPYLVSTFSSVSVIYKLRCPPGPHEN